MVVTTIKYETPGLGSSAVLMALRLPVGPRRTIGELRYKGPSSGRHIALPVSYVRVDDSVVVRVRDSGTKTWWKDFRSPHPVSIRINGIWLTGHGHLVAPGSLEHEEVEVVYQNAHARQQVDALDPYVVIDVETSEMALPRRDLGRRWFVAVTVGETLGFAAPASAGALTAGSASGVVAAALLMAGAIEGGVLGLFQAHVLRRRLRGFPSGQWVAATVVGALVAWTVGLIPVLYGDRIGNWPTGIQALAIAGGAIVMVFALGIAQWSVLRRLSERAVLWIWADAVGWIAGLAAFIALTSPLWRAGQSATTTAMIGALGGLVMAAVMAAITGAFLSRILQPVHLRFPAGERDVTSRR